MINLSTRSPVNKQSSKVLWKAPWWAHLNEEEKVALTTYESKTRIEDLICVTQPPPTRPGGPKNQIEDKRGMKIKWWDGDFGVVLGYAESKHYEKPKVVTKTYYFRGNATTYEADGRRSMRDQYWWAYSFKRDAVVKLKGNRTFARVNGKKVPSWVPAGKV